MSDITNLPCWVDHTSADVDAAANFYGSLFGWEFDDLGEEAGGYRMAKLNGQFVAALSPQQPGQEGHPSVWTTYVGTDDADATAAKAKEAGGQVFVEPFDVMTAGRMAVIADPQGAIFSIWQAGNHGGAEVFNEPGALNWNELHTPDVDGAKAFYGAVFGWSPDDQDMGGMTYTVWQREGTGIGGAMALTDGEKEMGIPPNWLTYFAVADADAAVETAKGAGANVIQEPMDIPGVGRFAVMADPVGAVFAVIKGDPQQP